MAPALLAGTEYAHLLTGLAEGTVLITVAAAPYAPYAVDVAAATHMFLAGADGLAPARSDHALRSVDPSRTPHAVAATAPPAPLHPGTLVDGADRGALACSAALVGAGERMLSMAVEYAGQRQQFGRVIGEYQALKHALAEVRIALDFARPLVHGAIGYTLEYDLSIWLLRARALVGAWGTPAAHRARVLEHLTGN